MAAGLIVGPEKNERVNVRNEPKTEEAMVAVLMCLWWLMGYE